MARSIQGSEVVFKEDVRGVLQAILITNDLLGRQLAIAEVQPYRAGFAAAIAAVATALSINLDQYGAYRRNTVDP